MTDIGVDSLAIPLMPPLVHTLVSGVTTLSIVEAIDVSKDITSDFLTAWRLENRRTASASGMRLGRYRRD